MARMSFIYRTSSTCMQPLFDVHIYTALHMHQMSSRPPTQTLGSGLPSIPCENVVGMLFEAVRKTE